MHKTTRSPRWMYHLILFLGVLLPLTTVRAFYPEIPTTEPFQQVAYIKDASYQTNEDFGAALALDGNILVVGAPFKDDLANSRPSVGAVLIYEQQTDGSWLETAHLLGRNSGDKFGDSVAVAGTTVVVGAPGADDSDSTTTTLTNAGAAYVYTKQIDGAWLQTAHLKPHNPDAYDHFGNSVAIDGTTVVVGANNEEGANNALPRSGAVYVYTKQANGSWPLNAYLKADNAEAEDLFGFKVAVTGATVVVSALREDNVDNTHSNAGAVYVFTKQTDGRWAQTTLLHAPDPDINDEFGTSVDVDDSTLVIGASYDDGVDNQLANSGAAFIYTKQPDDTWLYTATLRADNAEEGDQFGRSLSIDDRTVVVGAFFQGDADNTLHYSGAAYIYKQQPDQSWLQYSYLKADNAEAGDYFGRSVAVDGLMAVVGAPNEGSSGAAYVFVAPNTPPTADAGAEQHVATNSIVLLAGSASDDDGDPLTYAWRQINGSDVTLNNPNSLTSTFVAPSEPATLVFELTVTDDYGATSIDTVSITVDNPMIFLPMIRR